MAAAAGALRHAGGRPACRRAWELASPFVCKAHPNELCGDGKSTPQPAGPRSPLRPGRWVYEGEAGRRPAERGGPSQHAPAHAGAVRAGPAAPPESVRELASPFFAKPIQMSFAGLGNPHHSPPVRAAHCTQAGGYVKGKEKKSPAGWMSRLALAPLRGSLRRPLFVPFHTSPLSRGALRSAGVPTIAASTTPAPQLPRRTRRGSRGIWEDSIRRKGIPHVRRGVGFVGFWRLARPSISHRGYLPVGDAFRAEPLGRASSWGA